MIILWNTNGMIMTELTIQPGPFPKYFSMFIIFVV